MLTRSFILPSFIGVEKMTIPFKRFRQKDIRTDRHRIIEWFLFLKKGVLKKRKQKRERETFVKVVGKHSVNTTTVNVCLGYG